MDYSKKNKRIYKKKGGEDSPIPLPQILQPEILMKGMPNLKLEGYNLINDEMSGGKKLVPKKKPTTKKPIKKTVPKKKPITKKPVKKTVPKKKPVTKKTVIKKKPTTKKAVKK